MYIVMLNYQRPLNEVDALLEPHVAWLNKYFAAGLFISAGRMEPRTGGVLTTVEMERERLDTILAEDPFQAIAQYVVTHVQVTRTGPGFDNLLGV